jgi:hypothetical protein
VSTKAKATMPKPSGTKPPLLSQSDYNKDEQHLERIEPAWAKAAFYFRTGVRLAHEEGAWRVLPLAQVIKRLEVYRARAAEGETLALLHAIAFCANENLPLPTWLARDFRGALAAFLRPGAASTLDTVFKSTRLPTSTPKKAADARQDWELGWALYEAAWKAARQDTSLQSVHAVMKSVVNAGNFGVQLTLAKQLVAMVEKNQLELLGKPLSTLSRFLEVRRKT